MKKKIIKNTEIRNFQSELLVLYVDTVNGYLLLKIK